LEDKIDGMKRELEDKINKMKRELEEKIDRVAREFENKIDRVEGELGGRIGEVSERVSRLEERITEPAEPFELIAKLADLTSYIRSLYVWNQFYYIISYIEPKRFPREEIYKEIFTNIENAFSRIKNFYTKYVSNFPIIKESCKNLSGVLINSAYSCDVRFDDLTAMIFRTLGKKLASEIIDENAILESYGSEEAIKWKKLLS